MNGGLGNDTYIVDNSGDLVLETSAAGGIDSVQSSATFTLGSNIESLTLTGANAINGTGNNLANTLTGNGAANILDGGVGADTMPGGAATTPMSSTMSATSSSRPPAAAPTPSRPRPTTSSPPSSRTSP